MGNYQWIVTLYLALLITVTMRVSPLLTSKVGPGNWPFTVMALWVLHSLFTGVAWIFEEFHFQTQWTSKTNKQNPEREEKNIQQIDGDVLVGGPRTMPPRKIEAKRQTDEEWVKAAPWVIALDTKNKWCSDGYEEMGLEKWRLYREKMWKMGMKRRRQKKVVWVWQIWYWYWKIKKKN